MGIQAWKNHFHTDTKHIGLITDHFLKKEMCHNISEMDKKVGTELKTILPENVSSFTHK